MRTLLVFLAATLLTGALGFTDAVPQAASAARFLFPFCAALSFMRAGWMLVGRVRARSPGKVTRAELTEQPRDISEDPR